ncbi:hypothetical protein FH063_000101 [Azospirillum argentinense]|uniref:Uncharacterized protein n=1 Tax=Azospirillum argentinense TaxID=2970906 RepID=A0A5B0L0V3_9PROT|nr:hypothetical protein FH063_000101 [Azospirillum argentinense]
MPFCILLVWRDTDSHRAMHSRHTGGCRSVPVRPFAVFTQGTCRSGGSRPS